MTISKRKLESYRRAEIVAQASRALIGTAHVSVTQEMWDTWSGAVIDWMDKTGRLKYDTPKRRGRRQ